MSSKQVDERVVQMKFDNADFQKKTAETISTLDKLKAATNLDGFKGLKNVNDSIKGMDMSGVSKSVDECSRKFSALEIAGVTAIMKITSAAMDMGTKFIKSVSIDQVSAGFEKYGNITQSVQTILAATGEEIGKVTEQVNRLNWYTDETSYSLTDMTANIAKFTSNGIKLENATTQMIGIANAAALAGSNAQLASHAMEGFSKAIANNKMDNQTWNWIKTARIDTVQFKQSLIDAAVEVGTLKKAGDGLYTTLANNEVSVNNFNAALKDGWLNAEAMGKALATYGDFTNELYEVYNEYSSKVDTTSVWLDWIDKYKNGTAEIAVYAEQLNISSEEMEDILKRLSDASLELGNKSFKAGQEAKTFGEAIDSVKDAVSTGWMNTFQIIFGNYEEAKALWTGVANFLWDEFAAGGVRRNEILEQWKNAIDDEKEAINGRNELIKATANLLNLLIKPINAIKQGLADAFGLNNAEELGNSLAKATKNFAEFTEKIQPSEKVLKSFFAIAKAAAEVFKTIVYLISSFVSAIAPGVEPVQQVGDGLAGIVTTISKYIYVAAQMIRNSKTIPVIFNTIGTVLRTVFTILKSLVSLIAGSVIFVLSKLKVVVSGLSTAISNLKDPFDKVLKTATKFKNGVVDSIKQNKALSKVYAQEKDQLKDVGGAMADVTENSRELWDQMTIGERVIYVVTETLKKIPVILGSIATLIGGTVLKIVSKIGSIFKTVFKTIYEDFANAESVGQGFKNLLEDIKEGIKGMLSNLGINGDKFFETIDKIKETLGGLIGKLTIGRIVAIAFSIAILAMMGNISKVATAISGAVTAFGGLASNINKILKNKFLSKATPILEVAKAIALVAASLALLTVVNENGGLWSAVGALTVVIGAMAAFAVAVTILEKSIAKAKFSAKLPKLATTMVLFASAVGILSLSLAVLSRIQLSSDQDIIDLSTKVLALITLMAALVGATASLSIWAKQLPKNSAALLAIASSVAILVLSLKSLNDLTINDPSSVLASLALLIMGLAGITKMAEGIKISNALAVLAIAIAFRIAIPAIEELATKISEMAKNVIDANNEAKFITLFIITVGGVIAASFAIMKAVAPLIASVGNAVMEIGVGVFLFVQAANSLKQLATELGAGQIAKVLFAIAGLTAILVAFVALLHKIDESSRESAKAKSILKLIGVSLALLSFGATMVMLAKSMQMVAEVYQNGGYKALFYTGSIILGFGVLIAKIIEASSKCKNAKGAIAAMVAVIASMSVLLISLSILSLFNWYELIAPVIALGSIMYLLSKVFEGLGTIKKVDMKTVVTMVGSLLVVAGSLVILGTLPWYQVLSAGAAMSGALVALMFLLKTISSSKGLNNIEKVKTLGVVCGVLLSVGVSLALLATQEWSSILLAGVSMAGAIGMLVLLLKTIGSSAGIAKPEKIGVLLSVCGMLLSVAGAMYLISMIDTSKMLPSFLALAGVALVLGLVVAGLSIVQTINPLTLVGMGVLTACIVAMAFAATIMEGVDAVGFLAKMGIIVGALALITVIAAIAGAFPPVAVGLLLLSGVLLSITAVFIGFGAAAVMSGIGFTIIAEAVKGLQGVDLIGTAGGLALLAGALGLISLAGIGLGLAAVGMIAMALGISAIAGAAMLASIGLESIVNSITTLQNVDVGSIAASLLKMATAFSVLSLVGLGLPIVAAGMLMLSAAITVFSGSMSILSLAVVGLGSAAQMLMGFFQAIANGVMRFINVIGGFFYTIKSMFVKEAGPMANAANANATLVGKSFEKGFRDATGFHSPVPLIDDFQVQCATQFYNDTATPAAAAANGDAVGKSWGAALWEKITGVFKKIVDAIKGLFKKITGIGDDLELDLGEFGLDSSSWDFSNITAGFGDLTSYTDQFNESLENLQIEGIDYEEWMAQATEGMGDYSEATEGAGAATAGLGEDLDGTGKSAKKTKAELTDMEKTFQSLAESMTNASDGIKNFKSVSASNPFEAYEEKEVIDPKNVIENMKNISKTTSGWMDNLNLLFRRGVHTNLLKYLEELGIEGRDMVAAFVKMSDEQLEEAQGLFNHNLGYSEENAEAMLNSMHRKLDQVQQWGHNIKTLIERGLDEGIVKKLTDLGPDSADQVAAFASMTEDQLIEANAMFTAAMQISADGAGSIIASFAETGDTAAQEFIQGINDGKYGYIEAGQGMGLSVLNALRETLDTHSPSKETEEIGENTGYGLRNGLANTQKTISATAKWVAESTINNFKVYLSADRFEKLGTDAMQGLINGINTKGSEAVSAAEGIAAKCAEIMAQKWDVHSPSRVMMKLGRFFSEGAAIGIEAGAQNMYDAAATAAEGTVGAFEDVTSQVNDAIAFNCNPIITPKLDLSYIRSQMAEINSMFNDGTVGINGNPQNGGKSSGQSGQQAITFTQNNYSPKALSRTEIYRYTHNQLSMAGGYIR